MSYEEYKRLFEKQSLLLRLVDAEVNNPLNPANNHWEWMSLNGYDITLVWDTPYTITVLVRDEEKLEEVKAICEYNRSQGLHLKYKVAPKPYCLVVGVARKSLLEELSIDYKVTHVTSNQLESIRGFEFSKVFIGSELDQEQIRFILTYLRG